MDVVGASEHASREEREDARAFARLGGGVRCIAKEEDERELDGRVVCHVEPTEEQRAERRDKKTDGEGAERDAEELPHPDQIGLARRGVGDEAA